MRKLMLLGLVAVLTAVMAATALAATKTVKVGDNWFVSPGSPKTVTVKKGTTVRWRWVGEDPHNVAVTKGPVKFRSKTMVRGTFRKKMTRKGTYRLICQIHGGSQRMTLRVR